MSKQYYSILPPEARLQLLIEADIGTVLQLCDDEPFKNICDGNYYGRRDYKENSEKLQLILKRNILNYPRVD